ncbi:DUF2993 domain-containing protein [Agromyces laixinhei]|uniref:LmeA family phospholipid-binding protein n=1 Tax=Agromyces laixinhei TaxID=2585717 RepID=UPI0012EE04FE|nr:DUF2993 domain-containing protein [Agromyces laixinhei]
MVKHGDERDRGDGSERAWWRSGADEPEGEPQATDEATAATAVMPGDLTDARPTEVIAPPAARNAAAAPAEDPAEPRSRGRLGRATRIWIVVGVVLAAIVALVVVADVIGRGIAEQRVAQNIEANLPEGVEGDVDVRIGGFSVIAQYLSGTMQHVELSAPQLSVDGAPLAVEVVADGLPVDTSSPVRRLSATITADEESVNRLVTVAGVETGLTLGDGIVGYEGSVELLGLPLTYQVTATPTAAGDSVLLEPSGVEVTAGGASLDVSGLLDRLVGGTPIELCVADRLPAGVLLESVSVTPGTAVVELHGDGLVLDSASLQQRGTCD